MVGSELLKLRSTRAAPLIVAGTLAASLATAVLFANSVGDRYPDFDVDQLRSFDPTHTILRGRSFMQFTLGVLGALAVTAEHGTGTIVPSLAAVPNRTRFFAAKTTAVTGISLPTGLVATTGAFLAGQMMLQRRGVPHDDFLSHGSVRAVLGGGLHATASALLGFGTGTLTRTTAGAIATIVATQLFVPGIAPAFPSPISDILVKYWPTEAGARILATRPDPKLLGPWAGLGVMAASTAVVLGAALASFHQRDI